VADVIGRAIIEIAPDTSRFALRLARDLRKITSTFKKVSVGVSVGSASKAFREFTKLNLALRAATAGFVALGVKAAAAGLVLAAHDAAVLSGALGVLPAVAAAAAAGIGALQVGLFGVDDVIKAFLKGDMDKFNEKLKQLSPNAQQVLGLLKEFKPALMDFKNSVQDALFAGLEQPLRGAATKLLPLLKQGFVGISQEFNLLAKRLIAFSTSTQTLTDVKSIFADIKTAFHSLVPAGEAVAQAIRDIVAVGATFLPQIAAVIQLVAERFAQFIAKARESGALEDFIGRGLAAFGKLIGIIVDLGKTIAGVFRAAKDSGASILDFVARLAQRLRDFVTSAAGQEALGKFFQNAESAIESLLPVVSALGRLFNNEIIPIVTHIADVLSLPLAGFIDAIGQAFEVARPGIEAFASGVGKFLDGIAPALPAIGKLAGAIGTVLGKVLEKIAPILEKVIDAIANALTEALSDPQLVPALVDLAKAFGDLLIALAPLIPDLVHLAVELLPPIAKFLGALAPVIEILAPAIEVLTAVLRPFVDLLKVMADVIDRLTKHGGILGLFDPALALVAAEVDNIKDRGNPLQYFDLWKDGFDKTGQDAESWLDKMNTILTEKLPNIALGPAGGFVQGFYDKIVFYFGSSVSVVDEDLSQMVRSIFGIGPDFGAAGSALGESFTHGLRSGLGAAISAAQELANAAGSALGSVDGGAAGSAVARSFASGLRSGIAAIAAASRDLAGAAGSALPRSPAKVGPLSGRGWTPFRGLKVAEGFAEGIVAGVSRVRAASEQLAASTARTLNPPTTSFTGGSSPTGSTSTTPVVVRAPGAPNVTTGATNVRVYIDGRELRGVVVQVVDERDRTLRRNVQAGVGGAL
jgi:phage-related protein